MDLFQGIVQGFSVVLVPTKLLACFFGVLIGSAVGVLPGIGPGGALALLLPLTYYMDATSAVIMLAGIYYGSMYGGSTTSILIGVPGEAASVITCLDGYQMAKKGRAGPALGISAFSSFIAGTFGVIGLMLFAPPLARFALKFGPPEIFALILLAFALVGYLSRGSMVKALMMAILGLLLASVGIETVSGKTRFTFGFLNLEAGIDMVPLIMGLFGLGEVLEEMGKVAKVDALKYTPKFRDLFPTKKDWRDSFGPITRATLIGFFIGILPGATGMVASFSSYAIEKKVSKHPEKFGTGIIEGVAGPEAANNAAVQGAYIPMLTLGIPGNAALALTLGAMQIHGVIPGPTLIKQQPDLFWGVVASMYLGNVILLILNLPLIGIWVRLLTVPTSILYPMVVLFCIIGAYSVNNNIFDVVMLFFFGFLGYILRELNFELVPVILGFILGPIIEVKARQSLIISQGKLSVFFSSAISTILLLISFFVIFTSIYSGIKGRTSKRMQALKKEIEISGEKD